MKRPWTRRELDRGRCSNPDCTEEHDALFLHSRCHLGQGVEVEYNHGVLHIRCRVCKAEVLDVAVATQTPPPRPPRRRPPRRPRP